MQKRKQAAEVQPQRIEEAEASASTSVQSAPEDSPPVSKPSDGRIDLNQPMSLEALYYATAVESPFLAQNFHNPR